MSLMNDILKDLEKNKGRQVPGIAPQRPRPRQAQKKWTVKKIIHASSIALIACSVLATAMIALKKASADLKKPEVHVAQKQKADEQPVAQFSVHVAGPKVVPIVAAAKPVAATKPTPSQIYHALSQDLDSLVGLSFYDEDISKKQSNKANTIAVLNQKQSSPVNSGKKAKITVLSTPTESVKKIALKASKPKPVSSSERSETKQQQALASNWLDTDVEIKSPKKFVWNVKSTAKQLIQASQNNIQIEADDVLSTILTLDDRNKKIAELVEHLKQNNKILLAQRSLNFLLSHTKKVDPGLSLIAARFFIGQGENQHALSILDKQTPDIKHNADYYSLKAYALLKLKHFDESIAIYQSLVSLDPEQPSWWLALGIDYQAKQRPKAALNAYRMALKYAPEHIAYRYYLTDKINALLSEHS